MIKPSVIPALIAYAAAIGTSAYVLLAQAGDSAALLLRGVEGDHVAAIVGAAGFVMIAGLTVVGGVVVRTALQEQEEE